MNVWLRGALVIGAHLVETLMLLGLGVRFPILMLLVCSAVWIGALASPAKGWRVVAGLVSLGYFTLLVKGMPML